MKAMSLNGVQGRREIKHEMTQLECYLLRNKLKHYMEIDGHAKANGTYQIRSVYFDNFDNKVMNQKKEGNFERDKF
ncbi:VTC domain-containing protein, partial [Rossellomorea aquimaris]